MIKDAKPIRVSREAYLELQRIKQSDRARYAGRGLVGVVDDLILGRFTTIGRGGNNRKKGVDKK